MRWFIIAHVTPLPLQWDFCLKSESEFQGDLDSISFGYVSLSVWSRGVFKLWPPFCFFLNIFISNIYSPSFPLSFSFSRMYDTYLFCLSDMSS